MRVKLQSPFYCFWRAECRLHSFLEFLCPSSSPAYSVLFFSELPFPMARDHRASVILRVFSPSPTAGCVDIHSSFRSPNHIFPPRSLVMLCLIETGSSQLVKRKKNPVPPTPDGPLLLPSSLLPFPAGSFVHAVSPPPMQPPSHSLASVPAPQKPP